MAELKTSRPFQERFLDGFDRSQLRQEVQKIKPSRKTLRQRYAAWALGGAMALGGIGIPLKNLQHREARRDTAPLAAETAASPDISSDLNTAQQIADQVAGGVAGAISTVAATAVKAPMEAAQAVASAAGPVAAAPVKVAQVAAEQVTKQFFQKEVPFGSIIYNEAKKNDLPPELVAAVVKAESRFVPTARSGAGAVGLMQIIPKTGRWLGARDLTNPSQNITAGAKYLRYLHDRFDGNSVKAIAAYNAGEGNVRKFGGVPPFKETMNYVKKVKNFQGEFGAQLQGHIAEAVPSPGV
jgi:soluble lytic murein transglycosylase-like protein